jgi:hypothetical protein
VYNPELEIVPQVLFPPTIPFTFHMTGMLLVTVKGCVAPAGTTAALGAIVRPAVELVMVTLAEADLDVSAWETAATGMEAGLGTVAGAV